MCRCSMPGHTADVGLGLLVCAPQATSITPLPLAPTLCAAARSACHPRPTCTWSPRPPSRCVQALCFVRTLPCGVWQARASPMPRLGTCENRTTRLDYLCRSRPLQSARAAVAEPQAGHLALTNINTHTRTRNSLLKAPPSLSPLPSCSSHPLVLLTSPITSHPHIPSCSSRPRAPHILTSPRAPHIPNHLTSSHPLVLLTSPITSHPLVLLTCMQVPDEEGGMLVHSSTQSQDVVLAAVSAALGQPHHKVR